MFKASATRRGGWLDLVLPGCRWARRCRIGAEFFRGALFLGARLSAEHGDGWLLTGCGLVRGIWSPPRQGYRWAGGLAETRPDTRR